MGAAIVSAGYGYSKFMKHQYAEDQWVDSMFGICRGYKGVGHYNYSKGLFTCENNPLAIFSPGQIIFRIDYATKQFKASKKWEKGHDYGD